MFLTCFVVLWFVECCIGLEVCIFVDWFSGLSILLALNLWWGWGLGGVMSKDCLSEA